MYKRQASSRTDITLPQSQRNLIAALKATGKPLVLVLMNGRPLALVKEDQQADALLETWFAGTEGGHAIADVLLDVYKRQPCGGARNIEDKHSALYDNLMHECFAKIREEP